PPIHFVHRGLGRGRPLGAVAVSFRKSKRYIPWYRSIAGYIRTHPEMVIWRPLVYWRKLPEVGSE
ncbi:MAG: hypothetical protein SFY68_05970, partial [Candidatus Sumerlaeia bacterium]|nr:hypothetical protein [Candidatus Sumerlaeia bacterium]